MATFQKNIVVTNSNTSAANVVATISFSPINASISSFSASKGSLSGNKWYIGSLSAGQKVTASVQVTVASGSSTVMTVDVLGSQIEYNLDDNTSSSALGTTDATCPPPNGNCGQPTKSIIENFSFGVVSGNMAVNTCLSTHCRHRFSAGNFVNVDPASFDFNKNTGDFSLKPANPLLPWSFDFWVKSYDCTVVGKGGITQFEADGPGTISGDALFTYDELRDYILNGLTTYDTQEDASNDGALQTGTWFIVKDETYPTQGTVNVKL